jgi:uncharacterized membrane protein
MNAVGGGPIVPPGNGSGSGNGANDGGGGGGMPPGAGTAGYQFQIFDGAGDHAGGTTVNGIGNGGAVVGFSANMGATTLTNFIRTPDGQLTTLSLGSPTAMAIGINMNREVVGSSGNSAIVLQNQAVTTLRPIAPGNTQSEAAFGINDAGMIVGQYTTAAGEIRGFLLAGKTYTMVMPQGAASTNAQGVNKKGQVIGFFSTAAELAGQKIAGNPAQHGFLFDSAAGTYAMLPDPQQPNLFLTQYLGIDDNGHAVGYWQDTAGSQHGFVYGLQSKSFTFIDAAGAAANNGVSVTQIVGIDDTGAIAGFFVDGNGDQHGFYATLE